MNCQYHLAVSLHAPDDELRNQIVPANRNVGIAAILAAADYYFEKTGRRVTYEYVLLRDVNDRPEHARQLVALLKGRPALVNLIPYNPVPGLPFRGPQPAAVRQFVETLTQGGLVAEIRRRKGEEIDAACGQLRRGAAEGGRGKGEGRLKGGGQKVPRAHALRGNALPGRSASTFRIVDADGLIRRRERRNTCVPTQSVGTRIRPPSASPYASFRPPPSAFPQKPLAAAGVSIG